MDGLEFEIEARARSSCVRRRRKKLIDVQVAENERANWVPINNYAAVARSQPEFADSVENWAGRQPKSGSNVASYRNDVSPLIQ